MAVSKIHIEALKLTLYQGLSSDSKPNASSAYFGSILEARFHETDTGDIYYWSGTSWHQSHVSGRLLASDYHSDASAGLIPGTSVVHKYGRASTSSSGVEKSVSELGTMQFPTSASAMRVKAGGNAADTAAGAGAREITIYGLDETGALAEEAVATAGASASSATTTTFLRVFRARVTASGTYDATSLAKVGTNTGVVTIEDSGGVADYIAIPVNEGTSEYAGYHIPLGKTAYLHAIHADVDAAKSADVIIYQRQDILTTSVPVSSRRVVLYLDGVQGNLVREFGVPISFPALTDLWVNFIPSANSTECSVNFELVLVDD